MGKTKEQKQAMLAKLKQNLDESQLTLVINYQGLSVAEITDLRQRLIPTGSICSIAKNTLMGIAVKEDSNWQPMEQLLAGSNAFLFLKDDIGLRVASWKGDSWIKIKLKRSLICHPRKSYLLKWLVLLIV